MYIFIKKYFQKTFYAFLFKNRQWRHIGNQGRDNWMNDMKLESHLECIALTPHDQHLKPLHATRAPMYLRFDLDCFSSANAHEERRLKRTVTFIRR